MESTVSELQGQVFGASGPPHARPTRTSPGTSATARPGQRLRPRRAGLRSALALALRRERPPHLHLRRHLHVTLTVTDVGRQRPSVTTQSPSTARRPGAARAARGRRPPARRALRLGHRLRLRAPARARARRSVPAPVAAAAVVSRSLSSALRKGLAGQLLGQRAGRRTLRSADLQARSPSKLQISGTPGDGPARGHAAAARDREERCW